MYFSCKCNVSKILAPVVIRKKLMTVCMLPLGRRMRTLTVNFVICDSSAYHMTDKMTFLLNI